MLRLKLKGNTAQALRLWNKPPACRSGDFLNITLKKPTKNKVIYTDYLIVTKQEAGVFSGFSQIFIKGVLVKRLVTLCGCRNKFGRYLHSEMRRSRYTVLIWGEPQLNNSEYLA